MFGKRALKADGKAFACLKGDLLAFRLGDGTPAHTKALALPGAELARSRTASWLPIEP
ncbi:hypothetical protein ABT272_44115 [Streptomyces sp900105245]|uniref:Uncharacterized protein n=1 Tax=Streptomyces sp. 900105245 TaxID=3154379 RepID=A0ABV1UMU3_9ACTN